MTAEVVTNIALIPLLLNVEQVGEVLGGISPRQVRALVSARVIPSPVKIGKLSRWKRKDLQHWVAGLSSKSSPAFTVN